MTTLKVIFTGLGFLIFSAGFEQDITSMPKKDTMIMHPADTTKMPMQDSTYAAC